jgi:hypothetical protein
MHMVTNVTIKCEPAVPPKSPSRPPANPIYDMDEVRRERRLRETPLLVWEEDSPEAQRVMRRANEAYWFVYERVGELRTAIEEYREARSEGKCDLDDWEVNRLLSDVASSENALLTDYADRLAFLEEHAPALFHALLDLLPGDYRDRVARHVDAHRAARRAPVRRVHLSAGDVHKRPDFAPWIVDGLVKPAQTVLAVGPPKDGKTFAMLTLAFEVGHGGTFGPHRCRRVGVLYWAAEGSAEDLHVRAKAILDRMGIGPNEPQPAVYLVAGPLDLDARPDDLAEAIREAERTLAVPVGLVLVDTLAAAIGAADENAAAAVGRIHRNLRGAVGDAAVVVVHHVPHGARRARGSSALAGLADATVLVERTGDVVVLRVLEAKEVAPPAPFAFRLVPTDTGWRDDRGHAVQSLTMRPTEVPADVPPARQEAAGGPREGSEVSPVRRAVMEALSGAPMPRAELARAVIAAGHSRTAAYRAVVAMLTDGSIVETAAGVAEALA